MGDGVRCAGLRDGNRHEEKEEDAEDFHSAAWMRMDFEK
jgi:hypothetical protein